MNEKGRSLKVVSIVAIALIALGALGFGLAYARRPTAWYLSEYACDAVKSVAYATLGLAETAVPEERLSKEEMDQVVEYVVEEIISTGSIPSFTQEQIEEATGVRVPASAKLSIQAAVIQKLLASSVGRACLSLIEQGADVSGLACTRYSACSVWGDLSGASGEILEMYMREKNEDGRKYEHLQLPEFDAFDLQGNPVRSRELRGQPALMVFLAGHCTHSMRTFPILNELAREYGSQRLRVVAVLIHSGSVEDVNSWIGKFNPEYEVWVYPEASLGDVVGTHLVPTYFLVNAYGHIREKLVGEKTHEEVTQRISTLVDLQS